MSSSRSRVTEQGSLSGSGTPLGREVCRSTSVKPTSAEGPSRICDTEQSPSVLIYKCSSLLQIQNGMRPWAHSLGVAPEPRKVSEKHFEG